MFEFIIYTLLFLSLAIFGEEMMLLAGAFSSWGFVNFWIMAIVCLAGSYVGDIIFFTLGRKYGEKFISRFGKYFFMHQKRFEKVRAIFASKGLWLLVVSKFVYGMGHLTLAAAGASKLDPKKVIKNQFYSTLGFVILFGGIGYIFSYSIITLSADFKTFGLAILALWVFFALIGKLIVYIFDKLYSSK